MSKGKRLETVGDRTFARQKNGFYNIKNKKSRTNATKQLLLLPSEGAISDCFQPFPLGHLWTFKKKMRCAKILFLRNCGLDKFWPDHVSDRFRPFPTVSDRFHFSER